MSDSPRWMDPEATAKYICVRVDALNRLVKQGRIPRPNYDLGPRSPRWDRQALDAAFEGGSDSTNIDEAVRASVQKILQTGRARRPIHQG
jgi:hypothetical protein